MASTVRSCFVSTRQRLQLPQITRNKVVLAGADQDLPVLDQGPREEDGGLSCSLHTDLVHQAGVLSGQTVGGEESDGLGAGQTAEHFSSVILLLMDPQSGLAHVT